MNQEECKFTIAELYKLIWLEPITKLAEKLKIDAIVIRKKCKENNIPTPNSGYWSKLKFGKEVVIPELPSNVNIDKVITFDLSLFKDVISQETTQKNMKTILKQSRIVIESYKNFIINSKKYSSDGMYGTGKGFLNIYVTPSTIKRALRIFDAVIKLLNKKGYAISAEKGTVALIEGIKVPIRIREKNTRIPKKEQRFRWTEYDYFPSGQLVFVVELKSWNRKEFSENKMKLEQKIEHIVDEIIRQGINEKNYLILCEIHRKEELLRKEQEAARIQEINTELSKFKELFLLQDRWHRAQIIRNYLDEYERHFKKIDQLNFEKVTWIAWARDKADWYDPFVEKKDKLLDFIDINCLNPLPEFNFIR